MSSEKKEYFDFYHGIFKVNYVHHGQRNPNYIPFGIIIILKNPMTTTQMLWKPTEEIF